VVVVIADIDALVGPAVARPHLLHLPTRVIVVTVVPGADAESEGEGREVAAMMMVFPTPIAAPVLSAPVLAAPLSALHGGGVAGARGQGGETGRASWGAHNPAWRAAADNGTAADPAKRRAAADGTMRDAAATRYPATADVATAATATEALERRRGRGN